MRKLVVDLQSSAPTMALTTDGAGRLRRAAPDGWEVQVVASVTDSSGDGTNAVSDETMQAVADAEVYFGFGLPASLVAAAPQLKWAHSASAGVGKSITPELLSARSRVHEQRRSLRRGDGRLRAGRRDALRARARLRSAPAGRCAMGPECRFTPSSRPCARWPTCACSCVGAGGIGSAVARRFTALGAVCTGIRRRPELGVPDGFRYVRGMDRLDELLPAADVVVLAAPLTALSRGVMDARRLALLPQGAIVVNVARGALVDEAALSRFARVVARARRSAGCLSHANRCRLDIRSGVQPRVLVTPHVSGVSPARHWERALSTVRRQLATLGGGRTAAQCRRSDAGY